jgi:hypothetical protein
MQPHRHKMRSHRCECSCTDMNGNRTGTNAIGTDSSPNAIGALQVL